MTGVNHHHTLALLDRSLRGWKKSLEQVATLAPGLRPSHFRLLSATAADGVRLTDLAQQLGMTKQALGEFVATLQEAGFLQVNRDPRDRRARLVSPTPAGERVRAAINEQITRSEREWEARVGPERWAIFREVLIAMGNDHGMSCRS
jgi:DNA-binding MarR family transcriptional regulator